MAEYVQKDMTGSLFPNDNGDNDKRPDMRGTVTIDGKKYSISAWDSVAQSSGNKYISLKLSDFVEKPQQGNAAPAQPVSMDDEIPF